MAPSRNRIKGGVLRPVSSREPAIIAGYSISAHPTERPVLASTSNHPRGFLEPSQSVWETALSNGPRPSIDDDNGEGDQDLTSPIGDDDASNVSSSGQSEYEIKEEGDEDDDEEEEASNGPSNNSGPLTKTGSLQKSNSTPMLVPALPNAFAPPFYNRPPTPLPPSPSLTSLLRPSFSSRPTTPDDSESEIAVVGTAGEGSAAEAAVVKSARDARTVLRASPKVPTYEYYGFVLYLTSGLCFLVYLLWSYLPSPFLHQLGIYYYPNRWWSLAVPAFLVMSLVYIYIALAAYNTEYLTPVLGSVTNVVDEAANVAAIRSRGQREKTSLSAGLKTGKRSKIFPKSSACTTELDKSDRALALNSEIVGWTKIWNEGTDAVMDIPIGGVCEVLYGEA